MRRFVLLDTGPLVAGLDERDQYHAWSLEQIRQIRPPLLTCEAVLSEACFLLGRVPGGIETLLGLARRGVISVPFRFADETEPLAQLLARYANVPMSFADGCLVRMAELFPRSAVLTLDRDFHVYRKHRRQRIPTIMPEGNS